MKKFLSLLLALTLVLSLVVVPARAHDAANANATLNIAGATGAGNSARPGDTLSFSLSNVSVTDDRGTTKDVSVTSVTWSVGGTQIDGNTYAVASDTPSSITVSYSATVSYTVDPTNESEADITGQSVTTNGSTSVSVGAYTVGDITVKVKGHTATIIGNIASVTLVSGATIAESDISVTVPSGLSYEKAYPSTDQALVITLKRNNVEVARFNLRISVTEKQPSIGITEPASATTIRGGQTLALTASYTNGSSSGNVTYAWTAKDSDGKNAGSFTSGTTASATWKAPEVTAETVYTIKCAATEDGVKTESTGFQVTVTKDTYAIRANSYTNTVAPGNSRLLSFSFTNSALSTATKEVALTADDVVWSVTGTGLSSSNLEIRTSPAAEAYKFATLKIPSNCTATSCEVKAVVTKGDKTYTVTYPITISGLSTTLATSVQNGGYVSLTSAYSNSYTSLAYIAQNVLQSKVNSGLTVASATIKEAPVSVATAPVIGGTISKLSNGYYTFTAATGSLTPGQLTILATAGGNQYEIKLTIPVTPITGTSFETVTAEPVSSTTTTTSYRVYFPTTYSSYYVINKTGSTPSSWSNSMLGSAYSSTTPYTLYSTDFNTNGTCTLYVVAKNGVSGNYYSGQMVVTQTNYNINYNGVAGETVQFAQSDFNDFMQSVSEARGDASKTKSYPYVTFDYVTFSLPTTAQGTLYYGGTAMSTSNSSGAFNTRTKVTNLDSVTFVPNAKTTAKTITLNFTLYATRYSSSSTSRGTTVSYSGTVVVNLVREDIKYTVSQGDSVRFDESDFLSYLRSTKGYTSNYTIDYVTFDQSAVSAVNEGSLYTYYNGYNYGGSVKTTDKFYYSATASQNALSDVAFLASRYAKTGETVYIPFTIYARYGTTGTGTRQLTGTVAIKIGQTMNFIDVKTTDYFYNSVKWAVGKNITNGTSSTTFSPYKSCTRAEIVTFLWRAAGSPEPTITRNPFRDVNAVTHSSYYKAILWASQKGITSGTSATAFSPDQVCTRAQIVTFLYRYAGQPSGYYSNPFKDVGATSEASYYNAILWAVGKGITTGTSATTFSPYASCNRAEAVTFLYRYTNGL